MSLLEKVDKLGRAIPWHGNIPIETRYTVGIAGERFFRQVKDNAKFLGTRCPKCDLTYLPPMMYCERCFTRLEEWVEVASKGTVHTYTVLHIDLEGSPLAEPEIMAFVRLDGSDGGLVHRLGEVSPDEVEIGMMVEAVFKAKGEREGSILDIEYFKPTAD
jgi:uncharacterized OB-fold protein